MLNQWRVLLSVVFLCGCSTDKTPSTDFTSSGAVFKQMQLPAPSSVRSGSGYPGPDYWQQQVDHTITARLDVETNTLHASQVVKYHNNAPDSLSYLWFQLEQNIHRGDSIRSREGRGTGERSYDGMTITNLRVDGAPAEFIEYGTIAKIDLKTPLRSGESLTITMDWSFPFPVKASLRMGFDDEYAEGAVWEFAQWIPVPCVYDDVYGWNTLPYIGRGEFYTNFGAYDVSITVPGDHLVFGSGVLVNATEVLSEEEQARLEQALLSEELVSIRNAEEVTAVRSGGEKTWKFKGNAIRTFAWATSASFIWDAASVEILDLEGRTKRVLCQSAYPEETAEYWNEAVSYVQHSIKYYSETLYPYPWPQMSVVRGIAGGMEYPMVVFCRGGSAEGLFNVTDHEVGHDWFPMLVNTDERRHAWMDEGFNTFVNYNSLEAFYGDRDHKPDVPKYIAAKFKNDRKAVNTPPDQLKSRGHLSYRKPGYGLRFLREEILGPERFDFAFRKYVHQWAFKSPRPSDFYRAMENGSGTDLQWFFRGFFEEPMQLDQAIEKVEKTDKGVIVTLLNLEDWVCPVDLQITCVDGSSHTYTLPVSVWAWSNKHKQSFDLPAAIASVAINPRETYPDIDFSNNYWSPIP
ncbi:MAG: M1 family metallopeptidase [Phycisphaerales bacterium]|jgi:hypothetical protein|nr:M1 family metallopeptidase [Phycisphaerales bacterium]